MAGVLPNAPQLDDPSLGEARDLLSFLESRELVHHVSLDDIVKGRVPFDNSAAQGMPADKLKMRPYHQVITRRRRTSPSEKLQVVVDGNAVLSDLTRVLHERDPAWFFEGPFSPILKVLLEERIGQFRGANIEPIFVFAGMAVHGDVESFVNTAEELQEREVAWSDVHTRGRADAELMNKAFDVVLGEDVEMAIMRYLSEELQVETARAPFLQWGQMAAFLIPDQQAADEAFGPPELLLFDHVARVIVDIDFDHRMCTYIDKQEVLAKLFPKAFFENPSHASTLFLDLGLLTASHQSLALLRPNLDPISVQQMYENIYNLDLNQSRVSDLVFSQFRVKQDANHEVWKLMKGRAFIRHSMVLLPRSDGELTPLSKLLPTPTKVPKNLTGVLGSRLPPFMYYLQYIGLVSVGCMTTISQNYIRDDNPVSDTSQFRTAMEIVISLRTQVLYQLVQHFQRNEEYKKRVKVSWIRWFEPISVPVLRPPDIKLDSWSLQRLDPDLPLTEVAKITFKDVLSYADCGVRAPQDSNLETPPVTYRSIHEAYAAILLKSLDLLGYFTHITAAATNDIPDEPVSGPSMFADVLLTEVHNRFYSPNCVLLIEMLRTRSLSAGPWQYIRSSIGGQPQEQFSDDRAAIAFASRVVSLINIETEPMPFAGPIDRDIVSFNVMVKNMYKTLRTLTEVISASMFLDGSNQCPPETYAHMPSLLPFRCPPNCVAGFLVKYILTYQPHFGLDNPTPEQRMASLGQLFSTVVDFPAALRKIFSFWATAFRVISKLHEREQESIGPVTFQAANVANQKMVAVQRQLGL